MLYAADIILYNQSEIRSQMKGIKGTKQLDETRINEQLTVSQSSKPQQQFVHKLQHLLTVLFQNSEYTTITDTYSQTIQVMTLIYLIRLLQNFSRKCQITLKHSFQGVKDKLKELIRTAVSKYEFSYQMNVFYEKISNQQSSAEQLYQCFKSFFYQQSYLVYAQNPILWRKLVQYAVFQFSCHLRTFRICSARKEDIQQFQKYCQLLIEKQHRQQQQQLEKSARLLTASYLQVHQYDKETGQKLAKKMVKFSRQSNKVAKFKGLVNIKTMMVLEANFDILTMVIDCEAYEAPFLIFLVPFAYLLAETLSYYETQSAKQLSCFHLFQELIKKINFKRRKGHSQLSEKQLIDHIVVLANYYKLEPLELNKKLGQFLLKHGDKMKGFIPVYNDIFCFHAFEKYQFIEGLQSIKQVKERRKILLGRIEKLHDDCQKYNSSEILDLLK